MDDGPGHGSQRSLSEPAPDRRPRWIKSLARLLLGVAILAGLLWLMGPDWSEVRAQLRLSPMWLGVSFLGTAAATYFTAARWQLLNERMTATRLPFGTYFHYIALTRFLGQFSSMLLMDFVGRGVGLKTAGSKQRLGQLLTPVLLERLLDLLLPAALLVAVLVWHETGAVERPWLWMGAVLAVFCAIAIPAIQPVARLALAAYLAFRRWRHSVIDEHDVQVSMSTATWITVHSTGRFVSIFVQFFGMAMAAGAVMDPLQVISAMPVAQLSALISITPGGLGIQDAGWAGALRWLGEGEATITLFLLAWHSLIIVNFGLLSAMTLHWGRKRELPEG